MANTDLRQTTTSSMKGSVPNYQIMPMRIDSSTIEENYWYNDKFTKYLGAYKKMPQIKQSVDSFNMWAFGKGYEADPSTKVRLQKINGWGEETFSSIIEGLGKIADINGDAYAEKVYDEETGELVNLKTQNPETVRHVTDAKGMLIRYDVWDALSGEWKEIKPAKMFHISAGRIAGEGHGTSRVESVLWIVEAKQEAMNDWRRILHRSTIRVLEVDLDDRDTQNTINTQYAAAVKNGEILLLPKQSDGKETKFQDLAPPPVETFLPWIRYLDSIFYKAFGVPEVILGGAQEYTEAGSKVGYLTFEVPYTCKQREMEDDILNQLGFKVKFNRPASLKEDMQQSEAANTGQLGFQPNEMMATMTRNE